MTLHNRNPLILCLIGGSLLLIAGASGAIGVMGDLLTNLDSVLGEDGVMTVELVLGILSGLTILGGFGVILGGIIITTKRVEAGRILILLCTGMGVLGLTMSLAQLVMIGTLAMDLVIQLAQSLGWLGAIFSIIARVVAEQRPMVEK
ncbi:MAG: hypothetical protein RTU30_09105 [Candidatus Thorarchaeota archaeon]